MALLNVDKLSVHFGDEGTPFRAVDRISYSVEQGRWSASSVNPAPANPSARWRSWSLIDFPGKVMADKLEFNGGICARSPKRAPPAGGF